MSSELATAESGGVQVEEAIEQPSVVQESEPVAVDWILAELADGYDHLPCEAILEARRAPRELIVPLLIDEIRQAARSVSQGDMPGGEAHMYALFLLCEFRAREALPAILEAVTLPGEGAFELFGDVVTEYLTRVLLTIADDPLPVLEELIGNRELNEYVRWQGLAGYRYLVRDGWLSRGEAVERLLGHLHSARQAEDNQLLVPLLSELTNYEPREGRDEIRAAFDTNLIEEYDVSPHDFGSLFAANPDESAPPAVDLRHLPPSQIDDTIEELQGWASFRELPVEDFYDDELDPDNPWQEPAPLAPLEARFPARHEEPEPFVQRESVPTERLQAGPRIGRNEPCPCGSGKKFKKCCAKR